MATVAQIESDDVATDEAPARTKRVPGEVGTWVFILGDMVVFSLLFGIFAYYRADDPELFRESQATLNQNFGAINTLLLLLSSLLVVLAVRTLRRGDDQRRAPKLLAGALACGVGFSLIKVLEYTERFGAGLKPETNDFYLYYYVLTGLHFFHLIIGMCMLVGVILVARRSALSKVAFGYVEGGACYWHMVDLLWIVLFPLIYLMH